MSELEQLAAQCKELATPEIPWPENPWVMYQEWQNVFFMSWPVDPAYMRSKVPEPLEVDTFEGQAWISVLPMHMVNLHLRGLPPIPGTSHFPEINLRTYVRFGGRTGVFFFSIDAETHLGSWVADMAFGLPYHYAKMSLEESSGRYYMQSQREASDSYPAAQYIGNYAPKGELAPAAEGSLTHFLIERYADFTVNKHGDVSRGDIRHLPWHAQEVEYEVNANSILEAGGFPQLDGTSPASFHYSPGTQSLCWLPVSTKS